MKKSRKKRLEASGMKVGSAEEFLGLTAAERVEVRRRLRRPPPFCLPWLVTYRDFTRYVGRAMDACERGHVLLFWHRRSRNKRVLLALVPYSNWEQRLEMAMVAYHGVRYRRVTLANLPRRRRRITG